MRPLGLNSSWLNPSALFGPPSRMPRILRGKVPTKPRPFKGSTPKLNLRIGVPWCREGSLRANSTVSTPGPHDEGRTPKDLYELSLGLSRSRINGNTEIQCTVYDAKGEETLAQKMTKYDIVKSFGFSGRDLRTFDLPSGGFPHILIREQTILIHIFDLRLLIQADRVFLINIEETIGSETDNACRVFRHDLKSKLLGSRGSGVSIRLPYELRVVEAALASVTATLEAEYLLAKKKVSETLASLEKEEHPLNSELKTLLDLVRNLVGIEKRGKQVREVIQEVLNEDQDMADMHLSDKKNGLPHTAADHQDVEYLFEAYYKASDSVVQEAASLIRYIRQTEETIQSILNVRRNQIMVLEAKIEIVMVGLATATLVAGYYGMNVVNYLEESAWAFGLLCSSSIIGTGLIWRYGMKQLRLIQRVKSANAPLSRSTSRSYSK
ncbi:unnamed protein product [Clonostachys rosea f. rosea IK726]|uniref:Uncharacterized protein n=1 Tax=Clonostachys rosea f. rosea IK726 TaxID=1349383 RepID=A0ACA9T5Q0_BIOOC|nr:unnamed protein product [Clonostachys rosea f. rosea IK726]